MTHKINFKRNAGAIEVRDNGRYAAVIEKGAFDRKGYTIVVAIDRKTGAAAKISNLTFDKLATAKAFCEVWLASGDPRLAIHRTLCPLPEYFGR